MEVGKPCTVKLPNGKNYSRIVRHNRKDGNFIVIATLKYRERDMEKPAVEIVDQHPL